MTSTIASPAETKPFLKWPGGKRWIVPHIKEILGGTRFHRYLEPFLGGGAVFFGLCQGEAILSDINNDLVNVYTQVKSRPWQLIEEIQGIPVNKRTYLKLRASVPETNLERAVRFLYLNRTAFGGMYRLDKNGSFNVPFGGGDRTPTPLWEQDLLPNAARRLRAASILALDFEDMLVGNAKEGDLIYCDPTYTVSHNNNGFIRYNEKNFSWGDQIRLAAICQQMLRRGATVIVSNAFHYEIRRLYKNAEIHVLKRMSLLCPIPGKRHPTEEYVFVLRP